ncbi:MAG: AI-2E family transporter [Acidobacteriaceae bacterium]
MFLAFAGLLLAIVLRVITDWVEGHSRLGPHSSYAAVVCGLAVLLGLTAWYVVPQVISQTAEILKIIPTSLMQAKDTLDHTDWGRQVVEFAHGAMLNFDFAPKLAGLVYGTMDAAAAALIVAIVGLYVAATPHTYANGLLRLVPAEYREKTRQVGQEVVYTLRWWMLGQLVPMVVLGTSVA